MNEEILPFDQSQMMEETKFAYSLLGKAFKKQTETIEDQGRKQAKTLESLNSKQQLKLVKDLFPKDLSNIEPKDEIDQIKMIEQELIRDELIYKAFNKKGIKHMIFKSL